MSDAPRFEFIERPAAPFALAGTAPAWVARRWTWRLLDGDGRARAVSAEDFPDRASAEADARVFAAFVKG